jgi:hypothetical protein
MAYNSAHTGPEIDAAVQMLGQIQDARDATASDLVEVSALASQVDDNADQVATKAATVSAQTAQVLARATEVEQAHDETLSASVVAVSAKDAASLSAGSAQTSQASATSSASAAAQSQVAAGLSEQISAENAESSSADRLVVETLAQQVEADSASAQINADSAALSALNAAAVVTGGTATIAPAPGKIPLADAGGKINSDWLSADVARSQAIADIQDATDPAKGATKVGWDGETVGSQLDQGKKLADYAALRSYSGRADRVVITKKGIAGAFKSLGVVGGYVDDGGVTIISTNGVVWQRVDTSTIDVVKFGAVSGQNCDVAFAAAANYALSKQNGTRKTPPVHVPVGNWYLTTATPAALWKLEAGAEMFDLPGVPPSYQSDTSYLTGTVMRFSGIDQYTTLYVGDSAYTSQKKTGRVLAAQLMGASNRAAGGVSGFSYSSGRDGADQACIGVAGQGYNDNVTTPKTVWGLYGEGIRALPGTGNAFGCEVSTFNYAPLISNNPYQQPGETSGVTCAYWASAIGDYDSTAALGVIPAGKKFNRGIIFYNNSLVTDEAVAMPFGMKVGWHLSSTSGMASYVSSATHRQYSVDGPCLMQGVRGGATTGLNTLLKYDTWNGNNSGAEVVLGETRLYQTSAFASGTAASRWDWSVRKSTGETVRLYFSSTSLYPETTNGPSLGLSSNLWSVVYSATGTINTSDERTKQQIRPIDDACLEALAKVKCIQYKFNDAVEIKGDGARWHFGVSAQRVKEAFESEGLDAFDYGLLCYDEWPEQPEIKDEDGNVMQPYVAAGNRYGVRYEEVLAAQTERLNRAIQRLEARLALLDGA